MKERPILLSAREVRAIIDGSMMQTRRVIKPQPWEEYSAESIKCEHYAPCIVDKYGEMDAGPEIFGAYSTDGEWGVRCPYGQPGDRLWVRETFHQDNLDDPSDVESLYYRADGECCQQIPECQCADVGKPRWRPSIHMPRWASRITLEITDVRVERLQDITNNDALDEGTPDLRTIENGWDMRRCFQELWEQINGAGSWAENPWVWVIEFKKV
jgi:hypothetical protein